MKSSGMAPIVGTWRRNAARLAFPALLLGLWGCGGDLQDDAEAGPAQLSIVADFSANAVGDGARRAFDASDVLAVRVLSGGAVRYQEQISISPAGQDVRTPVELRVPRRGENLTVELELLTGGASLFDGGTQVELRPGEVVPVRVVLDPVVAGLQISPEEVFMDAYGETVRVIATPVFATGDPIDGLTVEWSTQDDGVATVNGTGMVTGVSDGDTRVVARLGDRTTSALVNIFATVASVTVDPPIADIPLGSGVKFTANLWDRNGNPIPGRPVSWSSSDASLIEVQDDGTAIARGIGEVDIQAVSGEADGLADARGVPIPPGAEVERAAPLDPRTIEVIGGISPNGLPTTAIVEWASDSTFTTGLGRSGPEGVAAGVDQVSITIRPTGFLPGARYFGRILVENGVGEGQSEIFEFIMPVALPGGETGQPTGGGGGGGGTILPGRVDPGGGTTRYRFQVSRTEDFTVFREIEGGILPPGNTIQDVQVPAGELEPGTFYCVRIVTTNEAGETFGDPVCFTTPGPPPPPAAPGVVTLAATDITPTTARLNASVEAGSAGTVFFEWGTNPVLGATAATTPSQPVAGGARIPVSADISGLAPGTTYYVRAVLLRDGFTRTGTVRMFTASTVGGPLAPSVGALTVTQGPGGATLTVPVNPNGAPTSVFFQWGTDPGLADANSTAPGSIGSGSAPVSVSELLSTLPPGTTIYVRVVAENGEGTSVGSIVSFTTPSGPDSGPPEVGITTVSAITGTGATFSASVNPSGAATGARFEWSTDPTFGTSSFSPVVPIGAGGTPVPVTFSATGLLPGITYYVRVVAENANGEADGEVASFTTTGGGGGGGAPAVGVTTVSGITGTAATFTVGVNPNGAATTVQFEWSTDPAFGASSFSPITTLPAGSSTVPVTFGAAGLTPSTTYYVRVVAENATGEVFGAVAAFTTTDGGGGGGAPGVGVTTVSAITGTGATFSASVNPNGAATGARFEWSTDPAFGTSSFSPVIPVGAGGVPVPVTFDASGLDPSTTYYVRVVAENANGEVLGAVASFTTLSGPDGGVPPSVETLTPVGVAPDGFKAWGNVNPQGLETLVWFEWGTDPTLATSTRAGEQAAGAGTTTELYFVYIEAPTSGVTYYMRAVASNAAGTTRGTIMSITFP